VQWSADLPEDRDKTQHGEAQHGGVPLRRKGFGSGDVRYAKKTQSQKPPNPNGTKTKNKTQREFKYTGECVLISDPIPAQKPPKDDSNDPILPLAPPHRPALWA